MVLSSEDYTKTKNGSQITYADLFLDHFPQHLRQMKDRVGFREKINGALLDQFLGRSLGRETAGQKHLRFGVDLQDRLQRLTTRKLRHGHVEHHRRDLSATGLVKIHGLGSVFSQ